LGALTGHPLYFVFATVPSAAQRAPFPNPNLSGLSAFQKNFHKQCFIFKKNSELKIYLEYLQIYKKLFHKKRKEDTKFHKANEPSL
jgi:hypothetical protein